MSGHCAQTPGGICCQLGTGGLVELKAGAITDMHPELSHRIPDLSHYVQGQPAHRWHSLAILRCIERGWRRDQASLLEAVREDPAVRAQVEYLTCNFA